MERLNNKDLWAGLMFVAFGVGALWYGTTLSLGTAVRMGPGYVPRMLSFIMIGLGAVVAIRALLVGSDPIDRGQWKPIVFVTIGVVVFAFLFERAGMVPATIALVFLSALGGGEFKLGETAVSSLVLCVICVIIFKLGLSMNISVIRGVW